MPVVETVLMDELLLQMNLEVIIFSPSLSCVLCVRDPLFSPVLGVKLTRAFCLPNCKLEPHPLHSGMIPSEVMVHFPLENIPQPVETCGVKYLVFSPIFSQNRFKVSTTPVADQVLEIHMQI